MKSLALAAVLCAATVSASAWGNHVADSLEYSGSGAFSLGQSAFRPLEQFYNYTNATGTLFNQTDYVLPEDDFWEDSVAVTWTWTFTAGYSGKYKSAPENSKIQ
jgi:hypothetical protein